MHAMELQFRKYAAVAVLLLLASAPAPAQTTISTLSSYSPYVSDYGSIYGKTQLWGQTFFAPNATDRFLDRFTFRFGTQNATSVTGRLMAWETINTTQFSTPTVFPQPVGPILFQAALQTTAGTVEDYTWNLGGIALAPTTQYVFFLELAPAAGDVTLGQYFPGDPYPGGSEVAQFESNFGPGEWPTTTFRSQWISWSYASAGGDLAFEAQFGPAATVTPEPGSMILLATGLLGLGGFVRRRVRKA